METKSRLGVNESHENGVDHRIRKLQFVKYVDYSDTADMRPHSAFYAERAHKFFHDTFKTKLALLPRIFITLSKHVSFEGILFRQCNVHWVLPCISLDLCATRDLETQRLNSRKFIFSLPDFPDIFLQSAKLLWIMEWSINIEIDMDTGVFSSAGFAEQK